MGSIQLGLIVLAEFAGVDRRARLGIGNRLEMVAKADVSGQIWAVLLAGHRIAIAADGASEKFVLRGIHVVRIHERSGGAAAGAIFRAACLGAWPCYT